eukprot:TRINITY_DN67555_c0_g1_i1.p1 TRINITY_DN67555_c0_g1~~TRINITY_DN67555_c0_g1_i1.p1  ORF type:complete len:711 (+),score=111.49 TRINITY_DN67555_c0_g1_i1:182-2314(+)
MRRDDRAARPPQRSNSQRRQPSEPRAASRGVAEVHRPTPLSSRGVGDGVGGPSGSVAGNAHYSPSSDAGDPPTSVGSRGRPPPDPGRVGGHAQAEVSSARRSVRGYTSTTASTGAAPASGPIKSARSSSTGAGSRAAVVGAARVISGSGGGDVSRSAVYAFLKVHGLNQYARAFIEGGLSDLDTIAKLSENLALEFLEKLRVYPGHRLRLLRAIDCLRYAHMGAERRDPAQMLEDDAALERLTAKNTELSKEKDETQSEIRRLQIETTSLIDVVRQQDTQLQKARDRIAELEELVQSQTEQVNFLTQQLQMLAEADPNRENELYKSYRDSFFDDWGEAEKLNLAEETVLKAGEETVLSGGTRQGGKPAANKLSISVDESQVSFVEAEYTPKVGIAPAHPQSAMAELGRSHRASRLAASRDAAANAAGIAGRSNLLSSPKANAKLSKSLDSAQVRECLAGFDVDHIIKCLATALHNKIIVNVRKSRPHSAPPDRVLQCAVFLDPACRQRLEETAADGFNNSTVELGSSMISGTFDPLNRIAVRSVPHRWDVYGFLRDVMMNFRLEPEVSIITLFYLERFSEMTGVVLTPDNWQRLAISAMMLASKVWNDESFENIEFAQLCPLYTLEEINTFEGVFLKSVEWRVSVKGSEYAKTYFLLRTLGAKDAADFGLEPINPMRASRLLERCLEKQVEFKERYPADAQEADMMNWTM